MFSAHIQYVAVDMKKSKGLGSSAISKTDQKTYFPSPYYKTAHILPLDQRIFFKFCLLKYKAVWDLT